MNITRLILTLGLAAALSSTALAVRADDGDGDDDEGHNIDALEQAVGRGEIQSLAKLKAIIRQTFPGEIVRVTTHDHHGVKYGFRVLKTDGRLIEVEMDAVSGRILEVENQ